MTVASQLVVDNHQPQNMSQQDGICAFPRRRAILPVSEEEDDGVDIDLFGVLDRGLSLEEFTKAESEGYDNASKWADVGNPKDTTATIGIAADTAWEQAKKEFEFVRTR